MKEKNIETYLREQVKKAGGRAYKFVSPGNNGIPDRLVCLPGGRVAFAELKAPGKALRPLQHSQQEFLKHLGFRVETIDNKQQVDEFMISMGGGAV